jgi:hypothetical protein
MDLSVTKTRTAYLVIARMDSAVSKEIAVRPTTRLVLCSALQATRFHLLAIRAVLAMAKGKTLYV